ncbi:hypothetical protein D3C86_2204900 [compost metagenome]
MDGLAGFQSMEDQPGAVGREVAQVAFDIVEAVRAAVAAADYLARVQQVPLGGGGRDEAR